MGKADILLNDFSRQWDDTSSAVLDAVRAVGASGWYILGKEVALFEESLAGRIGCAHAVGCASGLDAIELSLRALGIAPGDRVLTTPLSAFATTLAVLRAGGVPVFVDVDESGLVDLELAERELMRDRDIRFFLPVHLYGHALDLARLAEWKVRYGVKIVEDMAQAILAGSDELAVGSVGDASATSFYPTKNLGALGDGGAIFTSDAAVARLCRVLRDYGQTAKYVHEVVGLNSRLDELHAAVLNRAFLPRLASWTERRRAIADHYTARILHPEVRSLPRPQRSRSVFHLFPTLVAPENREALVAYLKEQGIHSAVHYPRIIPDQRALRGLAFEVRGELTQARRIAASVLSLPIHPYLGDEEVTRVIDALNGWKLA